VLECVLESGLYQSPSEFRFNRIITLTDLSYSLYSTFCFQFYSLTTWTAWHRKRMNPMPSPKSLAWSSAGCRQTSPSLYQAAAASIMIMAVFSRSVQSGQERCGLWNCHVETNRAAPCL